ncbi:flavodoxin family protein [Geomesophilobacter sediminis]|uniref:NAD(P)H-dependent oxidoreductase n=1 Tax=Geomesophilobacter sediminis TaxID=2798584 RepID=A0A8J7LW81_9BACT|nr:NAD(P)H-dependent oxidoreductase [Geomesophilobacter sediminis]MBJ6725500.1 NAD(P)H-dependent oxidoreductase [Geomesophilobacter sediminis]
MNLTAINGSPRGAKSNTAILLQHFLAGFAGSNGHSHRLIHLKTEGGADLAADCFDGSDVVLLGFPLYADAMPGIVKELIERWGRYRGAGNHPILIFLVQSGFPEGSHTRNLVPYLEKLSRRLGCDYRGTIRKGGVEGIRVQPSFMTRRLFDRMRQLGAGFGRWRTLDDGLLEELAGAESQNRFGRLTVNKMSELLFWNPALKRNGAYELRHAKPYAPQESP